MLSKKALTQDQRLELAQEATKVASDWATNERTKASEKCKEALKLIGDPTREIFGASENPNGEKSVLPSATQKALLDQQKRDWKVLGFDSAAEAEKFWKQSYISNSPACNMDDAPTGSTESL